MRNLWGSFAKRWYSWRTDPRRAKQEFSGDYWRDEGEGVRSVPCRQCPKFDAAKSVCTVPFGTSLRKCIVASIESHFHDCKDISALEIGFGHFWLPRNLILRSGGTWTGIEPRQTKPAKLGQGGHGQAGEIPFPDDTFDLIYGIQSLEHWAQSYKTVAKGYTYDDYLREVHRVLKPGGTVYFDVPIHDHGHEMFIMGDFDRIRGLFGPEGWEDVLLEKWREDHDPLPVQRPRPRKVKEWQAELASYPPEEVEKIRTEGIAYIMAITARKRA